MAKQVYNGYYDHVDQRALKMLRIWHNAYKAMDSGYAWYRHYATHEKQDIFGHITDEEKAMCRELDVFLKRYRLLILDYIKLNEVDVRKLHLNVHWSDILKVFEGYDKYKPFEKGGK